MHTWLKKGDSYLHSLWLLWLALGLVILLRIPNFMEPYWYGDEGIYLTIGNSLRQGQRLYADIVDHKTPLIYYLAMTPSQVWFRVLNLLWMMATTTFLYLLIKKFLTHPLAQTVSLLSFVLLTTLPMLEGNIPNGELFVMGWVLAGAWILSTTTLYARFRTDTMHDLSISRTELGKLLLAGSLFGLGLLTKVPALFDFLGWLTAWWFGLFSIGWLVFQHRKKAIDTLTKFIVTGAVFAAGFVLPLVASIGYFWLRGTLAAYLEFGLLYNFHYVSTWKLVLGSPVLEWLMTMPGKVSVVALLALLITALRKWVSPVYQLVFTWFAFALFASLLSNRPYPHYFQQLVPPLSLLLGYAVEAKLALFSRMFSHVRPKLQSVATASIILTTVTVALVLTGGVMLILNVGFYPTWKYYQRYGKLVTGQISVDEYRQQFNGIMHDNYLAAPLLASSQSPYLFIWGTNPMLYAQTNKIPSGRFTVSFHIHDLKRYDETLTAVKETNPEYIVMMNGEPPLPGLDEYVQSNYIPNVSYDHFVIWKRSPSKL